ncbi:MAG: hypothetical protein ACKN9V_00685 [Pseudomonadota bacterium]
MRKKQRKLYFLFGWLTVLSFLALLGWYLSDRFRMLPTESHFIFEEKLGSVQVAEQKDSAPEEVRPLPDISAEELAFRQRAQQALEDFPRKNILKEQGRDLHKPPQELLDASAELGTIEDLLDKNPSLVKEGLRFYRRCALNEALLNSLRGLCLHNLKTRAKASGFEKRIRWNEFPDYLHRIADKL